jgi:hypothetical protein
VRGSKKRTKKPATTASAKKGVSSPSAAAALRDYHVRRFWDDVQRLPVEVVRSDHPLEAYRGLRFFASLAGMDLAEARRPLFTVCFYFESLIDQGLHHLFHPDVHAQFQAARPLPKFGYIGTGPHIERPNAFLSAAKERWPMATDALNEYLTAGAAYFCEAVVRPPTQGQGPVTGKDVFIAIRDRDEGGLDIVVGRQLHNL